MISCEQLLYEISNYLDDAVDPHLRAEIEAHLVGCRRCSMVLDSTRKTIRIIADERVLTLPAGFSSRLRAFLATHIEQPGTPGGAT
jgi:hypothetical protein